MSYLLDVSNLLELILFTEVSLNVKFKTAGSYCGTDVAIWVVDGDDVEVVSVQHPGDLIFNTVSGHPLKQIIKLEWNRN